MKRLGRSSEERPRGLLRGARAARTLATPGAIARRRARPRRVGRRAEESRARRSGKPPGRTSLLAAASALFAELGYDAVTTRQILERAGVEAPSLYHHFGSKLGLYRAVLAESSEPFVESFGELGSRLRASSPGDVRARLRELVWAMFQGQLRNPEAFQIALFEVSRPGPRRYDLIAVWEQLRDVFRATIDAGIASGELELQQASSEVAANLFLGGLTVYLQLHQVGRQRSLTRRLAGQIADTLVEGIAARAGRSGRSTSAGRGAA